MKRFGRKGAQVGSILALLLLFSASIALAQERKAYVFGVGIDFATGDYGTDTTTDSVQVPLSLDYYPTDRLDVELVVPFLYQSSSTTILSGGMRYPVDRGGRMRRASLDSEDSQSGLGDITLTAGYKIQGETAMLPGLRPLLYLKFPTADEDKGLGTGEFDIGGGLGAYKWFDRWYTFAEGRYIFQGSNSDLGLKDYGTLEGEVGYRITDRFLPSVSLWWSSPPADASPNLVEGRLMGKYWATDDISMEGYLGTGLSSGTADFLAGVSVFYSF